MAEGGSDEIIDKQVCGLCLETYMKEPKLLSCFHSFCLRCLEEYVKKNVQNNKFQCPLCNDSIDLPQGGVTDFETNIYIDIEALSKIKHYCDLCGHGVDATNHCVDCNENYCKRCTETHTKMKVTRTHSLINVDLSDDKQTITKNMFCEKHPKEEVKVICKDCDMMLCLVCKLTDHEKHTSIDIEDEAKNVMDSIQLNVQEMFKNISILEDVEQRQRDTEQEANKRKRGELEKVKHYKEGLDILLAKRMEKTEDCIAKTFDTVGTEMLSSMKKTKNYILSCRNWALQVEKMMVISDKVSIVKQSYVLKNSIEKHTKKMAFYSNTVPEDSLKKCHISLTDWFFNHTFSPVFMKETVKFVSISSECKMMQRASNSCRSLSVFQNSCFALLGHILCKADSQFSNFVDIGMADERYFDARSVCVVRGNCYFSRNKEIQVWNQTKLSTKTVANFEMYPQGIAYRNRDDYEELLVCLSKKDLSRREGFVRVLPLCFGQAAYDFFSETDPGPSRVAVNTTNGLVCLGYFYSKISIHSEDGTLIHTYDQNYMGLSDSLWLQDVCFDNENCIIIADKGDFKQDFKSRHDGKVLRVNIFGKVLQVLLTGNEPQAVAVSRDDKLWVGYRDKNVTVYQLKNA